MFPAGFRWIREGESCSIRCIGSAGRRPKGIGVGQNTRLQIGNRRTVRQKTQASVCAGYHRDAAARQHLPELFVSTKQEQLVLFQRATQCSSKLVPLERGSPDGLVEEVPGVKGAVAQIFEYIAV